MVSQRASITRELLRESLESVLKPFKIHWLDDGKSSCVLEFLMGRKVFVSRPTGSGTQLVVSNIRLFSRVHSPRARCVKQERICQSFSYPGSNEIGRYVVINTEGKWTDQTNEINKEFFLFFYVLLADSSSPFRQISWLFCNPDILGEQSKFYFGCFPSFPAIIPHLPEMRKAIGHFWPILKPVSTHTPTPDLPGAADLHTSTSSQTSFPYWY